MTFSKQIPLLLFLFFFPLRTASSDPKPCYTSSCRHGEMDGRINVRFPFWLFPKQPESCGQTGFNLLCTDHQETTIKLPNSGTFLVRDIDYRLQRIRLNDPKKCLAKRLLTFDASGSPFSPLHLLNYVFFSCPREEDVNHSLYKPIHCLGFAGDLNDQDLWLKWDSPNCSVCEAKANLRCGFINNTTLQVQCVSSVNSGLHNTSLQVLQIICFSLIGPVFALTFCVGLVMCSSQRVSSQIQHAMISGSVTPQPSDQVITRTGLDESTIESYKKVELGESRRLPTGSNDVVCSICLSEYATKETVRCLPECEHCFHTGCIDAWLKLHSSCPVCRSNPSPSREMCN
ncbi:RING-H2 finger protein ATL22 isoform X2 [Eutrema salsugineum]|uniref:RING-H2 finger protein ATL22 isoform X2 n=1 Tax=Eutrema salsugineum TaxID=72664 RepID=UPI000CED3102|nr:RING-H2 finger protein ATL22 isoform X2 [Eutrema salsugineum]